MLQVLSPILACHGTDAFVAGAAASSGEALLTAGVFERMADSPLPAIAIGGAVAIVAIIASAIKTVTVARSREQTRRELAAYVAEGTLDPDKAVEILKAGRTA